LFRSLAKSKTVSQDELRSLFEAARWAPSSWYDRAQFERLLSRLVEGNQAWAKHVPVLALGIVSLKFAKNVKDNRDAVHDLGLAAGNLVVEATARGLRVHQMIGILPDKAREVRAAINRFVEETNSDPKPFVWTADAKRVLAAVKRGKEKLESIH
jgi:nitroreductase